MLIKHFYLKLANYCTNYIQTKLYLKLVDILKLIHMLINIRTACAVELLMYQLDLFIILSLVRIPYKLEDVNFGKASHQTSQIPNLSIFLKGNSRHFYLKLKMFYHKFILSWQYLNRLFHLYFVLHKWCYPLRKLHNPIFFVKFFFLVKKGTCYVIIQVQLVSLKLYICNFSAKEK